VDLFPVDIVGPDERTHVVRVPSRLTHETAILLRRTVEQAFALHSVSLVILDLSLVEVVSSIGVTALLEVNQIVVDAKAKLVLAGFRDEHRSFFTLLRVDRLFQFSASVEDAVSSSGSA